MEKKKIHKMVRRLSDGKRLIVCTLEEASKSKKDSQYFWDYNGSEGVTCTHCRKWQNVERLPFLMRLEDAR